MTGRGWLSLVIICPSINKKGHFYFCIYLFNDYESTEPLLCSRLLLEGVNLVYTLLFRWKQTNKSVSYKAAPVALESYTAHLLLTSPLFWSFLLLTSPLFWSLSLNFSFQSQKVKNQTLSLSSWSIYLRAQRKHGLRSTSILSTKYKIKISNTVCTVFEI